MSSKLLEGEYFADYDENTGVWGVFHTDYNTGHAFSTWGDQRTAELEAERKNKDLEGRRQSEQ